MKHFCILCALPAETAPFVEQIDAVEHFRLGAMPAWIGRCADKQITLVQTGVGKVHAAAATQLVISQCAPDAILSCGTAGNLSLEHEIGDVVIAKQTLQHDYGFVLPEAFIPFGWYLRRVKGKNKFIRSFPAHTDLLQNAETHCSKWNHADFQIVCGTLVTGDQVIFSSVKRSALASQFQALAVDMESAAIAQVCAINRVPFLSLRGLSDSADDNSFPLDTSKIDLNAFEGNSSSLTEKMSLLTRSVSYLATHPSAFRVSRQAQQNIALAAEHSAFFTFQMLQSI